KHAPPIPRLIVDDPLLHPHARQCYPDEVRIGAIDGVSEQDFVGFGKGAKGRAQHARNFDVRLQFKKDATQLDEAFLGIAEEKMTPGPRCVPQRVSHEVRTIHAVLEASPAKVEGPYHRHPVRQHQVEPGKSAGKFRTMTSLAKDVRIGRTDRSRSWL